MNCKGLISMALMVSFDVSLYCRLSTRIQLPLDFSFFTSIFGNISGWIPEDKWFIN